jgi:hypothetical protein
VAERVGKALPVEMEIAVFGFQREGRLDKDGSDMENPIAEIQDVRPVA